MVVSGDTIHNAPAPQLFPKAEELGDGLNHAGSMRLFSDPGSPSPGGFCPRSVSGPIAATAEPVGWVRAGVFASALVQAGSAPVDGVHVAMALTRDGLDPSVSRIAELFSDRNAMRSRTARAAWREVLGDLGWDRPNMEVQAVMAQTA